MKCGVLFIVVNVCIGEFILLGMMLYVVLNSCVDVCVVFFICEVVCFVLFMMISVLVCLGCLIIGCKSLL